MCKRIVFLIVGVVLLLAMIVAPAPKAVAVVEKQIYTATNGTGTDALDAWDTGSYSYIKLTNGMEMTLNGQSVIIDLNGNDLNVQGAGDLQIFDSANDSFDHANCGSVTVVE